MSIKISKKSENFSEWYNQVIREAKLADHGPARGTMIFRPNGYVIWEAIQRILDRKIKEMGAQNAYFPLFIPYSFLEKEEEHVKGFSPELAVVTIGGGEKLSEPLVVRPTSETIMYDAFSRWIQSYRDLPLKINQWANVVRWEKRPYLFLRTTEFLWQEGHTVHETPEEAQQMVDEALRVYVEFYQKALGLYGYAGRKSESEKFAGAVASYSYEILMPDGKIVQACTSHNLGQNFAKVFNVKFQNKNKESEYGWQTSWGLSSRSIGPLIGVHGDDKGLILPPAVAPVLAVIIPIVIKSVDKNEIYEFSRKVLEVLSSSEITTKLDDGDQSPGWKFSQYEMEGIPLRIEIGPSEVREQKVSLKSRDGNFSESVRLEDLVETVRKALEQFQKDLLEKSKEFTQKNTRQADNYDQFKEIMKTTKGYIEAFWCEDPKCEEKIKEETKASTRNLPLGSIESKGACVYCGKEAKFRWLFGQSY